MKIVFAMLAAVGIGTATFGANEYWQLDLSKDPTFGAYGSEADWWELSGAEVKRVGDALEIRNVDNNASITPDEIARDLLGLPADAPITKKEAAEAKQKLYEGKRGGGKKGFPAVGWRRGLGQNENTKEKSNMDFTLDFDMVAYK